jgi:integrase
MPKYARFKEIRREKLLTPDEQNALSSAPNQRTLLGLRDYAIIKTFLNAGLRKAELLDLRVCDLQNEGQRYWLMVRSKGGNFDEQELQSERTISAIKKYLARAGHGALSGAALFKPVREKEGLPNGHLHRCAIDYMLAKYAKKAGLTKRVTAHMLRHTFGTEVYAHCHDVAITQRLLRHRSISSTMIYLHSNKDRARAVLGNIDL